jgi:hypothetical protein
VVRNVVYQQSTDGTTVVFMKTSQTAQEGSPYLGPQCPAVDVRHAKREIDAGGDSDSRLNSL